jgi:hypothetical protein
MNRVLDRVKKRVTVRYGREAADRLGFTEDLSPSGIFVKTAQIMPPGSTIRIDMELGRDELVQVEGTVVWAKKVPQELTRLVKKSGMGVRIKRFLQGEEAYLRLFSR